jgi:hypothetical protein
MIRAWRETHDQQQRGADDNSDLELHDDGTSFGHRERPNGSPRNSASGSADDRTLQCTAGRIAPFTFRREA